MLKSIKARCLNWSPDKGDPLTYRVSDVQHAWPPIKFAGPLAPPQQSFYTDLRKAAETIGKKERAEERKRTRLLREKEKKATAAGKAVVLKLDDPLFEFNTERVIDLHLNVRVAHLLDVDSQSASRMISGSPDNRSWLPERELVAYLHYPLRRLALVGVEPFQTTIRRRFGKRRVLRRQEMTVGWLLWCLAQGYQEVYERHEEFGVWGHGLHDLFFEGIRIVDHHVSVYMGS